MGVLVYGEGGECVLEVGHLFCWGLGWGWGGGGRGGQESVGWGEVGRGDFWFYVSFLKSYRVKKKKEKKRRVEFFGAPDKTDRKTKLSRKELL